MKVWSVIIELDDYDFCPRSIGLYVSFENAIAGIKDQMATSDVYDIVVGWEFDRSKLSLGDYISDKQEYVISFDGNPIGKYLIAEREVR